jgi:hypothetical protein
MHPECGKRLGAHLEQVVADKLRFVIYCEVHRPLRITKLLDQSAEKFKREFQRALKQIVKQAEAIRHVQEQGHVAAKKSKTDRLL